MNSTILVGDDTVCKLGIAVNTTYIVEPEPAALRTRGEQANELATASSILARIRPTWMPAQTHF